MFKKMDESQAANNKHQVACSVCNEEGAKMHYGALSCLGCKNFFRRSITANIALKCSKNNTCPITAEERSCRACRLQKCLKAGMDPARICPDRDHKEHQSSSRIIRHKIFAKFGKTRIKNRHTKGTNGELFYMHELPVEMRTIVIELRNTIAKVMCGDTNKNALELYPLNFNDVREILEKPERMKGLRTKISYEPYRIACQDRELLSAVNRRLLAAIDWVEQMAWKLDGLSTDDKIALVKNCFGTLTVFIGSVRTALVTGEHEQVFCLCNAVYVNGGELDKKYTTAYHLDNELLESLINRLVRPFRQMRPTEEEIACSIAIIVLNPMAPELSEKGIEKCFQFRNRLFATLQRIMTIGRTESETNVRFGNLLLQLPIITLLADKMYDNLRFAQMFNLLRESPVIGSIVGFLPIFPFSDNFLTFKQKTFGRNEQKQQRKMVEESTQTEEGVGAASRGRMSFSQPANLLGSMPPNDSTSFDQIPQTSDQFLVKNHYNLPTFASQYITCAVLPSMFEY